MKTLSVLPIALTVAISGCGGGGGGGSSDNNTPPTSKVSFSITDAPVDDANAVVITIDKVILRRDGATDVVVDRFNIPPLNLANVDTFQIDLLDYQNGNRLLIINDLVVPAGNYSQLILQVIDGDITRSYVEEIGGAVKPIKQPSGDLKLGGFAANQNGVYAYTLDFDLRKALTYNPGPERYILKPRGVRVVDQALAASLSGSVNPTLFNINTVPQCATKPAPTTGNVVYLYQGTGLTRLVDIYDPDIATGVPTGSANPYSATDVYQATDGSWHYNFGFVPAGNYTLAFSCNAAGDFAESYDGISIPLPTDQATEMSLTAGQTKTCNLPIAGGACGP